MNQLSLQFDAPDAAAWLWIAVGFATALELLRYALVGRHPERMTVRAALGAVTAGGAAALLWYGRFGHVWACVLLAGITAAWVVRAYAGESGSVGLLLRRTLLALRLACIALVALMLTQPVLQSVHVARERAVLGILVDDSRSMSVRDVVPEAESRAISRAEAVQAVLARDRASIARLLDELDVQWYLFDTQVRERKSVEITAGGEFTALLDAVASAQASLAAVGRKVAGLIVISDGRDTFSTQQDPTAAGDALAAANVPLYALGVGSDEPSGQTRRLHARRLDAVRRVSVLNRLPVRAEFLAVGLAGQQLQLELLYDGTVVDQRQVDIGAAQQVVTVDLEHVPPSGGIHRITVRGTTSALPDVEASLSQLVEVVEDRIRVLYIDRPRYERAAVARALEASEDLHVTKMDAPVPGRPDSAVQADLTMFDVVLLGDVNLGRFSAPATGLLETMVSRQGRGLGVLAGSRTAQVEHADARLLRLLPFSAARPAAASDIPFALTPAGRSHPLCRFRASPAENAALWTELSPARSAVALLGTPPAAEVLLRAAGGEALLAVQQVGKGRVAAIGLDDTWGWSFKVEDGVDAQRRFWRQLVLWLANRRPQLWVATDRPRYELPRLKSGVEQVVLRGGITEPVGADVAKPTVTATLHSPGGRVSEVTWTSTPEGLIAHLRPEEPGEYKVTAAGSNQGVALGTAETAFLVESVDLEMVDPLADLATLRRLSARTAAIGGKYAPVGDLGRILDRIRASGTSSEVRRVRRTDLVNDAPWMWLVVLIALLTAEWAVRRRAGMV